MRTEVIGLNAWLAAIQVPGITPACPCGARAQTVRHVLFHYPRHKRVELIQRCGTERLDEILSRVISARHAARWLVASGAMEQFKVTAEIAKEDIAGYRAFSAVKKW